MEQQVTTSTAYIMKVIIIGQLREVIDLLILISSTNFAKKFKWKIWSLGLNLLTITLFHSLNSFFDILFTF